MSIRHAIVIKMDQIISDKTLRGIKLFERLLRLSHADWREVYPGWGTPIHSARTFSEKKALLVPVRAADEPLLYRLTNCSLILEMLDVPATGQSPDWRKFE
jgi:hypothetical protein